MHISRLHKWKDEYIFTIAEEDAARLGLAEGSLIDFDLTRIDDPASSLREEERTKVNHEYISFKQQLDRLKQ